MFFFRQMDLQTKIRSLLGRSDHNYFLPFVLIVTLLVGLWMVFLSHDSLINWARAGIEVKRQEAQMQQYQREIDAMDAQIKALGGDRDSLEKFARERYHFAAPGEDVYLAE